MTISYNYWFDVSAIVIYIVSFIAYHQRKHLDIWQHRTFLHLFIAAILTPVMDIVSALLIDASAPVIPTVLVTLCYYLVKMSTLYFFLFYVLCIQDSTRLSLKRGILLTVPILIILIIILLTPWTGWLFSYSQDSGYKSGSFRRITYIAMVIYYALTVIYIQKFRKSYNTSTRRLIRGIALLNMVIETFQYYFSSILLHSFSFSVSMLLLVINIERYASVVDSITGLAHRDFFDQTCERYFQNGKKFSVILISMPDYETLVQNYGMTNIEKVQSLMSNELVGIIDKGKAFSISNSCIALIQKRDKDVAATEETVYSMLIGNWELDNVEVPVDVMITAIACPEDAANMNSLVSYIQLISRIKDKKHFGIIPITDFNIQEESRMKSVEKAIENGLKDKHFQVYYQPIYTSKDKKIVSAEALIRLTDPELGNIGPDEFIPISERNGTILQIGIFVLEKVCEFIETHDMEKMGLHYIEVNLSAVQCLQKNFLKVIDNITKKYNIDPKYLCFEITETGTNDAPKIMQKNLLALTERGYLLALDDFGTGYSSIQRMVSSEYGIIKFDKVLTQQFCGDEELKQVYRKLQAVFKVMESKVVSEGVETKEQYEFVRDAGASYIQGYYFSKPLSEKDFCSLLEANV